MRRVEERVLVDRVIWLATGSPNPQVRAIATARLEALSVRLKGESASDAGDRAAHAMLARDIQQCLDRPFDPAKIIRPVAAPPGAPIGDVPMDWLEPAPWK